MLPTDNRGSATYLSHIFTRRAMAYLPCTPYWHKHMRLFMKMKQLMQSSLSLFPMSEETKRCRRCVSVYLDSIQWHHLAFVFAVLVCVRVCVCLYTVRSTTYPVCCKRNGKNRFGCVLCCACSYWEEAWSSSERATSEWHRQQQRRQLIDFMRKCFCFYFPCGERAWNEWTNSLFVPMCAA